MEKPFFSLTLFLLLLIGNYCIVFNNEIIDGYEEKIAPNPETGSLLDLDIISSAFHFSIITKQDIQESGARNLSELLEIYIPGLQYLFNPFYGTVIGMRGICNDRNTKFIFLVNNHKLNMHSRDGFKSELVLGMLGDIKRIEVLHGAASFMYGSGALAGIINIITDDIQMDSTHVSASLGTLNDQEVDLSFIRQSDDNTFRISLGGRKSDGLNQHASRLYGIPTWPYPNPFDTYKSGNYHIEQWEFDGVPSDGHHAAVKGNLKLTADWEKDITPLTKIRTYLRYTHQEESAGGLFIYDPWPEYTGNPVVTDSNSNEVFNDWIPSVSVDYKDIMPDNPFWPNTESYGDNRRMYVVNNLAGFVKYTHHLSREKYDNCHEFNFQLGFDKVSNMTLLEKRDRYQKTNRTLTDNILETFGETRLSPCLIYQFKQGKGGIKYPNLQWALGIEGEWDAIGNDWFGRNQWSRQSKHNVVTNIDYFMGSLFGETFFQRTLQGNGPTFNCNIGLRIDVNYYPEFTYTEDSSGVMSDSTLTGKEVNYGSPLNMLNGKLAFGMIPKKDFILKDLKQAYKVIVQRSSNNGSTDNYFPNRYHYNADGNVNGHNVFEDTSKIMNAYQPVIAPFIDRRLSPEHLTTIELLMNHMYYYGNNNSLQLTNSIAYGVVENLFAWSQSTFSVKNAGCYSYLNHDIDLQWQKGKFVSVGISNTWQRPLKIIPPWISKTNISDNILYTYTINANEYFISKDTIDNPNSGNIPIIVEDAITSDWKNFLNLSNNVTKVYATIRPSDIFSFHSNCRLFWGFAGRKYTLNKPIRIKEEDPASIQKRVILTEKMVIDTISHYFNFWNATSCWPPIIKLDASIHIYITPRTTFSLYAYNILGIDLIKSINPWEVFFKRNTLRPIFIADPKTNGFVSTDQISIAAKCMISL